MLHLATHGFPGSDARPLDASLALAVPEDGRRPEQRFLTLERMFSTWTGKLTGCELVVLSACHTQEGVEVGDSFMALPWGFFQAGATTVVASLWRVDDTAAALLMGRLHENLAGSFAEPREAAGRRFDAGAPMPKGLALLEAKRWLRSAERAEIRPLLPELESSERGAASAAGTSVEAGAGPPRPYADPYYWAGFVLLGDPGAR